LRDNITAVAVPEPELLAHHFNQDTHTHRTKPNLGRACASPAGASPDAYGRCTSRRAKRRSAERLKDRSLRVTVG
jgi:hypothetical protein